MTLFDSHAHYDDHAFDPDRAELLAKLPSLGVVTVVNIGCDVESSEKSIELAKTYPYIYATVGIHPGNAEQYTVEAIEQLRELARSNKQVVAIGEIGLDYHYPTPLRDIQRAAFAAQMELARELNLPVCIHDREAHGESLEIVRSFPDVRGVFHCFSGSVETARELVERGWYIGFTGVVSFKNAKRAAAVAAALPLERILIETDCPYMAPEPYRGKRCDSSLLQYTGAAIARIRGLTPDEIYEQTAKNAAEFYKI
jgi:TatD DNase family protein